MKLVQRGPTNAGFEFIVLSTVCCVYSITFYISIGLCAVVLVVERMQGLTERTWVAGVNASEIIIAQICTQSFIVAGQVVLLLCVSIFAFDVSDIECCVFYPIPLLQCVCVSDIQ